MNSKINIIDLFAGPGGLGEGFSSYISKGETPFRIRMSVEKEQSAHKTLTLRAFYRLLRAEGRTKPYFDYVEGRISKDEMIKQCPEHWAEATAETMEVPTELGKDNERIHAQLKQLKKVHKNEPWVVIGGPPCQAYSLVGRARNKGNSDYVAEEDARHFLYKEYLQVLSIIEPDVFVMENVKGILSAKLNGENIFPKILTDLENPKYTIQHKKNGRNYTIYSFVQNQEENDLLDTTSEKTRDYVIRTENYGIPQTRHRVILLGIASDLDKIPSTLEKQPQVPIESILQGLPHLRSKLSKEEDTPENWKNIVEQNYNQVRKELKNNKSYEDVLNAMGEAIANLQYSAPTKSNEYQRPAISSQAPINLRHWLTKEKPKKVLNHEARGHMNSDLGRYLYSACWALPNVNGNKAKPFPKSEDYPEVLAPAHANWKSGKFADRFRVQRHGRPATTVTSHISKDGHYFIHPDPTQCRSLTVREAARVQTFPDNYFFEGNRTEQYVQVGNAVPPFLAVQLAGIVDQIFQ
jgi:DNA (cytosine-5)-methyltransferase 1